MQVKDLNWMQVEQLVQRENRAVLPIGSTEQHAYLSLAVDSILAERVATEAAEPLGIPVFPVLAYGITPLFMAYPGTVTLSAETHARVVTEVLDSLVQTGFRRLLIVNGHGGNEPTRAAVEHWVRGRAGVQVRFHAWWKAPRTMAKVTAIDPVAGHASWMENFPWTRLAGVAVPAEPRPVVSIPSIAHLPPEEIRERLGDGNCAGLHQRDDAEMEAIWQEAVAETRELLTEGW